MFNKTILIGRLVADPELRTTPKGASVATCRIAVDRPFGGERKTDFITIVCWRQTAEFVCKYFAKGRLLGVDGSIQTREYTDKQGNKRHTFEVVADRVFFAESKPAAAMTTPDVEPDGYTVVDDDDLPF